MAFGIIIALYILVFHVHVVVAYNIGKANTSLQHLDGAFNRNQLMPKENNPDNFDICVIT